MKVRILTLLLVVAASAATVVSVSAQSVVSKTDRSQIHACTGEPPKDGTIWHADKVGVDRLIPSMPGSDTYSVSKYFRGYQEGDLVSEDQKTVLMVARQALEDSVYKLFFSPDSQAVNGRRILVPQRPPGGFYDRVIEASLPDNLRQEVLPCWTQINGLTYGTRIVNEKGKTSFVTYAIEGPVYVGWYKDGAWVRDRRTGEYELDAAGKKIPGAKVTLTGNVIPADGRYKGTPVQLIVFDDCGNVSGRIAIGETTGVVAALPVEEPRPKIIIPPYVPPFQPEPPRVEREERKAAGGWIPCIKGKGNKLVCGGIVAGILAAFLPHGSTLAGPPSDNNTPVKKP